MSAAPLPASANTAAPAETPQSQCRTQHLILATAGHVDHGKSALVEALTGTNPTHLPEEHARGITIELGFAHLTLPHPERNDVTLELGIVDVPGHEDFIRNMVSGVGSVDLALLVVACDDGWMPQTEEHVQILEYLGIRNLIVALSKCDMLPDPGIAGNSVRAHLLGTCFQNAPIVPVSAHTGHGLPALRKTLASVCSKLPPSPDIGKPRLWVDRALTLRGVGTVVTGTLSGGKFRRGDTVMRQPGGIATRIRGIQTHGQDREAVGPGQRVALNLSELSIAAPEAAFRTPQDVRRGDLITLPECDAAGAAWDVSLQCSSRSAGSDGSTAHFPRIRQGLRVRIHHGTGQSVARLVLAPGGVLQPGWNSLAQLRFETAQPAFIGDRFVMRDWTARQTLAGGVVLHPCASPRGWRQLQHQLALTQRSAVIQDPVELIVTELVLHGPILKSKLLSASHWSASDIATAADRLVESGRCFERDRWLVHGPSWAAWLARAEELVDAEHKAHPQHAGLELTQLRAELCRAALQPDLFESLRTELLSRGFSQTGAYLRRRSHRPELPAQMRPAAARIRANLEAQPLEPPARKTVATSPEEMQVLHFLIETGQVVEVGPDIVFLAEAWTRAVLLIKGHLRREGTATAGQLREVLGTSRRVIVPVLERLDHDGVTVREGDLRRLKPKPTTGAGASSCP